MPPRDRGRLRTTNMNHILVLDDSPLRLNIFRRRFEANGAKVTTVSTAQDAIDVLTAHDFDLICLDHDLGGQPPEYYGQDCDPDHHNTGSAVARWMKENPKPYKVMLHTRNPIGAASMKSILETIDGIECLASPFDALTAHWGLGTAW